MAMDLNRGSPDVNWPAGSPAGTFQDFILGAEAESSFSVAGGGHHVRIPVSSGGVAPYRSDRSRAGLQRPDNQRDRLGVSAAADPDADAIDLHLDDSWAPFNGRVR